VRFSEILKEVAWRVLTEERVSYRTIKRDFGLDEEDIEELRFFLTQRTTLATDLDGRFLVRANGSSPPVAAHLNSVTARPEAERMSRDLPLEATSAPSAAAAVTAAEPIGAERRQVTVMFCDLVGSTDLASQLDPEDMADVIRAYQGTVSAVIRRFDGYIAKFMGDGVLVYFGFPHAQEKDAGRAVRAGLAILDAVPGLNADVGRVKNVALAVRIGIATGVVMVGETVGTGAGSEKTIVGETPNLAARLQGLATPNAIVLSALTRTLAGEEFVYVEFGAHQLKGISEPVSAWRVAGLADTGVEADGDAASAVAAPLLVGRDEEIGLLRRAWQQSRDERRGHVVIVSGEPGIGKSTLIRALRADVMKQRHQRITMRCSQYHTNSALYPAIEHFKRAAGWQAEDNDAIKLEKLERVLSAYSLPREDTVPLLATLLSLSIPKDRYSPLQLTPQQLKQQTADVLVALTLEEAEKQPVLQMYEDLHWADPSTLDLIGLMIEQAPTAPLLMVLTFRPDFVPPWPNRSHMTPITLSRLERPQIEILATGFAGDKELPRDVLDYIVRKTDGVPLYVEELTKTVLGSSILKEQEGRYVLTGPLSSLSIPASLQEVLMARLDRLPAVREVAQLGAVFGREFAYQMIQAISAFEEQKLRDGLSQLVGAELLYQRGRPPRATYTFKHALIQDAAYHSLLKRTRQHYHQLAATFLETSFPELVEAQPELLAHHHAESGQPERAIAYLRKAAERAALRSAHREVIAHVTRALELLKIQPDDRGRAAIELALQRLLGSALMATKGYAASETGAACDRARQLCQVLDASDDICPVLSGVWLFVLTRANHVVGSEIAHELLTVATAGADPEALMVAHVVTGISDFHIGSPARARPHLAEAIRLHQTLPSDTCGYRYGLDFGCSGYGYSSWCEWLLGRPDEALRLGEQGVAALEQGKHLYTMSRGLYWNAVLHQLRGEWSVVRTRAKVARKSAKEHGYAMVVAASRIMEGAARAALGDVEGGLRSMRDGLEAYRATGARFQRAHHLVLLADALRNAGGLAEAFGVLTEAAATLEETSERYYEAEIHRVRGALILARDRADKAEAICSLQTAVEIARMQQARSLELLAARDLAAFWAEGGERQQAHDLLSPVFATFTEGLDTPALMSSRLLLDALR
jgi:class 3 adenylate cyclase/predicted ATPase